MAQRGRAMRNNMDALMRRWWDQKARRKIQRKLLIVGEKVTNRIKEGYPGITLAGYDLKGWTHGKGPVWTGALVQSVRVDASRINRFTIMIVIGKKYAAYVEFGTSKTKGRPFLRRAIEIFAPWAKMRRYVG